MSLLPNNFTDFATILDRARERKGGQRALEALLREPLNEAQLLTIPEDRYLSAITRCVTRAGFSWKVIDAKWPGFEEAFEGFDIGRWVLSTDDDLGALVSDTRIVRNGQKIASVPLNARFFAQISYLFHQFSS